MSAENSLSRLTTRGMDLMKGVQARRQRKRAEKRSRTTREALQERRLELQNKHNIIEDITKDVLAGKFETPEEMIKALESANLIGMNGYLLGMGLIVDSLTMVYTHEGRDKDGNKKLGKRRISVADMLIDMTSDLEDLSEVTEIIMQIMHDLTMYQMDIYPPEAPYQPDSSWRDNHGVMRSPYFPSDPKDVNRARAERAKEKADREKAEAEAAEEVVTEEREQEITANPSLQRTADFIRGRKPHAGESVEDGPEDSS